MIRVLQSTFLRIAAHQLEKTEQEFTGILYRLSSSLRFMLEEFGTLFTGP